MSCAQAHGYGSEEVLIFIDIERELINIGILTDNSVLLFTEGKSITTRVNDQKFFQWMMEKKIDVHEIIDFQKSKSLFRKFEVIRKTNYNFADTTATMYKEYN